MAINTNWRLGYFKFVTTKVADFHKYQSNRW